MLFIFNVRDPATNSLDVRDKVVDDNSHNDGVSLDNMPINETEPTSPSIHLNNHIHNHSHSHSFHYYNWTSLREVNGLLNEDIVMIVASTGQDSGAFFRDRIIPSTRTWMLLLKHVFVVIEDTNEARFNFRHSRRHAQQKNTAATLH
jgi:hypothetical protein